MKLPRILITAMRSGAAKTMLTCGILKAMKMQEINPASFKCEIGRASCRERV